MKRAPENRRRLFGAAFILALAFLVSPAHAQFTSTPVTTASVGELYMYQVEADGLGNVEIVAPNGLPYWLELRDGGNGEATLLGTPVEPLTTWSILLRAENNFCRRIVVFCPIQQFEIVVGDVDDNQAPVIVGEGIADRSIGIGESLTLDVASAFNDPDGDSLSFSATGLPPGFTFSGSVLSGFAFTASGSPYTVTVSANDGRGGQVSTSFDINVLSRQQSDYYIENLSSTESPVLVNELVQWDVLVANAGPATTGELVLTVLLDGISAAELVHSCSVDSAAAGTQLLCYIGPLAADEEMSVSIEAMPAAPGDIHATATLGASAGGSGFVDPSPANNRATAYVQVGGSIVDTPAQAIAADAIEHIAAADVDRDGWSDLLSAGNDLVLRRNTSVPVGLHPSLSGSSDVRRGLAEPVVIARDVRARALALADLDNDGDPDLVAASAGGAASAVYRNDDGVFTRVAQLGTAGSEDAHISAADVNADGNIDILVGGSAGVRLHLNQGALNFAQGQSIASGPGIAAMATVVPPGAQAPDLVVSSVGGSVVVFPNSGSGSFGPPRTIDTRPASSIATGDFNRDGYNDLILGRSVAADGSPANVVLAADALGAYTAVSSFGASPTLQVIAADVDMDDLPDVVAINDTGLHQIFVGDGTGNLVQDAALIAGTNRRAGAVTAIGRLGVSDLVVAGDSGIDVYFGNGRGQLGLGDNEPPVITLLGAAETRVEVESAFSDPGATATDDLDGAVSVESDSTVNTSVVGSYSITYRAVDSAGNAAAPVSRTVHVGPREARGSGGGGSLGPLFAILMIALIFLRNKAKQ